MSQTVSFPLFGDGFSFTIPKYFTIAGLNIYYYSICIILGFTLAALYLIKRRELFGLTTDHILDMLLIAVPCGIVGARIYYMLFNFDSFFGPGKWENIFKLREGGLAVYGGIIFSGLAFIVYSRVKKISLGSLLDAAGFGLFIGQAVGRWGNFINVEAYGIETELPWKMGITTGTVTTYHHPTFLYESLWNIGGLLIVHTFSKNFKAKYKGQYFLFYVAWYGLGRFMIEGLRVDSLYLPGSTLRVSQWLAAISFIIAIVLLLYNQYGRQYELAECSEADKPDEQDETDTSDEQDAADEANSDTEDNTEEDSESEEDTEEDSESEEDTEKDSKSVEDTEETAENKEDE